jgi:hypothetical protein
VREHRREIPPLRGRLVRRSEREENASARSGRNDRLVFGRRYRNTNLFSLVAAGVVVERTAEHHGVQELAALLNFRQGWVVLQGIRIDGAGTI